MSFTSRSILRSSNLTRSAFRSTHSLSTKSPSVPSSIPTSRCSIPRTVSPLSSIPQSHRNFSSSTKSLSKDTTWLNKGDTVTYSELKPETQAPSGQITIIDVREPNEVSQGMIPSSVNVPLTKFKDAFNSDKGSNFSKEFAFDRPSFDDKIIFYCRSGKRSQEALETARKHGWWNTRNYTGSYLDWVQQEEARSKK